MYPDMNSEMRDNFLNMAVEECNRMLRIVMDLLTLSRLDNHKTKWKIAPFDLKQTLIHICQVMQVEATSHRHSLRLTVPERLPEMNGDAERIEQVLINILSNAVKYTPDGGEIEVTAEHKNGLTAVSIRDNGIGIPAEDIPRLFERFYRVEKARTSEMGGTGLGLAIAKEIIAAHGGSIQVSSEVGKGTLVTITLPLDSKLKGEEN
ncbi:MAG: ATP-binding protein, partial [Clostridia bacterium]|nr:ATP-binding protein [Clostridia bacterium]